MAAFSFGSAPAFGTTTTNTSAPAFGFGATPATTTPAAPSLFGSTASTAPTFGTSFGFGNPATTTTTTTGTFSFAPTTTSATGFGLLTAKTTQSTGFGTGTLSFGTSAFGQGTSAFGGSSLGTFGGVGTTPSAFGNTSFGNTSTGFGTGLGIGTTAFGSGTSTFGSLGTNTSTFGGLGSGTSGFGTGTFGSGTAFGTGTSSFGGLGTNTFNTGTLGSGLGTGTSFGGLGAGTSSFGRFGQQVAPIQNLQSNNTLANTATALSLPLLFGDERDTIIAKWNQLQAFWGTGKGYYSNNAPPVDFTAENPFCRFKAIGYSCIPKTKNEDGLVAFIFNKKDSDIRVNQQQLVDNLQKMMGNKPNLSVCVAGVKPMPDDKSEVTFYVMERALNGTTRRITANEFHSFLLQPNIKTQLVSLSVENLIAKVEWSKELQSMYLEAPPAGILGIDPLLWQQAKLDNPDSDRLIPVPMIGFSELHQRLKFQEQETKLHQGRLDIISGEITELQRNHSTMAAKISNFKQHLLELGHRVLQVMVKQEIRRKMGFAIQADEERLRVHLEAIQSELSAPTQFKGRLNELLSQIRMQKQQAMTRTEERYSLDVSLQYEIKQHLKLQQDGLSHLISIIKEDVDDLTLIEQSLQESIRQRR